MISIQEAESVTRGSEELTLEVVRDPLVFAGLRAEWDELLGQSSASIFSSWEWLYPWYRRIAPERELLILVARQRRRLTGLMPLCLNRLRSAGRTVRRISFLGETHVGSEYLDVVARIGFQKQVARAFARQLRGMRRDWDLIDLLDVDSGTATLEELRSEFGPPEFELRVSPRNACPYESFSAGETFENFLPRTARKDNYSRRRSWLRRQPGFRIETVRQPSRVARPLADFFRLHALRWADDGGSQGIAGARTEAFHRDAAELLAELGALRFYTLSVDGRALASVYAIAYRDKFLFYQSGYDPEWRNKSVGLVLLGETFRDCIEAGCREYDFLRGTETYKLDWTTCLRRTVALRIFERGSPGQWLDRQERVSAALRGIVKRTLPSRWVGAIRARRRRRAAVQS